jgi:hypothetical protein
MKNRNPALLSFKPIESGDLRRLLDLARQDRHAFFQKYPEWARLYADRVIGVALCQGAAVHYTDTAAGINDFDVYTFFAAHPERRWYAKRLKSVDFGNPKFGQSEITRPGFRGRRVDLMSRAIEVVPGADLTDTLRRWLSAGASETARELRKKAVVLLEPEDRLSTVVWPI